MPPGGLELDDDPDRININAVHDYLSKRVLLGKRTLVLSDHVHVAYLCDVYVLAEYRGRGLGVELVREAVENGPQRDQRWWLDTKDAHGRYRRFGFGPPDERYMARRPAMR